MTLLTFENCIFNNAIDTNIFNKLIKESSHLRRIYDEITIISKNKNCTMKEAYTIYCIPFKNTIFVKNYNNGYGPIGGGYYHPSCSHGSITRDDRYSICN